MILKMPTLTIIHHGYLKKKENIGRGRLRDYLIHSFPQLLLVSVEKL